MLERLVRESIVRAVCCYSACYPVSVFMCTWLVPAAFPCRPQKFILLNSSKNDSVMVSRPRVRWAFALLGHGLPGRPWRAEKQWTLSGCLLGTGQDTGVELPI